MTVKFRSSGWEIGGKKIHWTWGVINYWDIERSSWKDVLRAYKHSDNRVVVTNILPSLHERQPGHFDFSTINPNLELSAFLQEVKNSGLKLFCWIGPREVPGVAAAGYPEHLLTDPEVAARDHQQQLVLSQLGYSQEAFSLPYLLHPKLKDVLMAFKTALQPILEPFIHPDGPVIGIGVTQAPGWNNACHPFAADYHPLNVQLFQNYLKKRYNRISKLNQAHAEDYATFKEIKPPTKIVGDRIRQDTLVLDWMTFKEDYFVKAAELQYEVFAGLKCGSIPMILGALPTVGLANNLVELEKTRCFDYVMPDVDQDQLSQSSEDSKKHVSQIRALTMFNQTLATTPELIEQQHYHLLQQLVLGVRGWNVINTVGTGLFQGFLTNRIGKPNHTSHPFWDQVKSLQSKEGFFDSQLYAELVFLQEPDLERLDYCFKTNNQQPEDDIPDQVQAYRRTKQGFTDFCRHHQFNYIMADGRLPTGRLNKNQIIVLHSYPELSHGLQQQVNHYYKQGHTIIVLGDLPEVVSEEAPFLSFRELLAKQTKKPATKKKRMQKSGKLHHLEKTDGDKLSRLCKQIGVSRELTIDSDQVVMTMHKYRNRLYFTVDNPSQETIETTVRRNGKFVLKEFWLTNKYLGGNNDIQVVLPPRSVTLWELIVC